MLNNHYLYGVQIRKTYLTGKTDPSLRRSDLGKGKEISGIREILGVKTRHQHGTWEDGRGQEGGNLQPKRWAARCQIGMFCLWPQGLRFDLWIPLKPQARWWFVTDESSSYGRRTTSTKMQFLRFSQKKARHTTKYKKYPGPDSQKVPFQDYIKVWGKKLRQSLCVPWAWGNSGRWGNYDGRTWKISKTW